MYCKLKFDILLLTDEKPLTYMYLIHDLDNNEELLECLHHVPSHETADVNRCLVIPTTKCNPHGKQVIPPVMTLSVINYFVFEVD